MYALTALTVEKLECKAEFGRKLLSAAGLSGAVAVASTSERNSEVWTYGAATRQRGGLPENIELVALSKALSSLELTSEEPQVFRPRLIYSTDCVDRQPQRVGFQFGHQATVVLGLRGNLGLLVAGVMYEFERLRLCRIEHENELTAWKLECNRPLNIGQAIGLLVGLEPTREGPRNSAVCRFVLECPNKKYVVRLHPQQF